jgi:hypothetical protein
VLLMACCVLVAALFGAAFRKFAGRGGRERPVKVAHWTPPAADLQNPVTIK